MGACKSKVDDKEWYTSASASETAGILEGAIDQLFPNLNVPNEITATIADFSFVSVVCTDALEHIVDWEPTSFDSFDVATRASTERYDGILLDISKCSKIVYEVKNNTGLHFGFGISTRKGFQNAIDYGTTWQRWGKGNYILFDNHYSSFQEKNWGQYIGVGHITTVEIEMTSSNWSWNFFDKDGSILGTKVVPIPTNEQVFPVIVVAFCGWFMSRKVADTQANRNATVSVRLT